MDKVTQINVEGHLYELLAGQAVAGTSSASAASYVKVVVFEDTVSLISGMMLAVKFANENTAGFSGNKTVYSLDGETFYYDQAMTDLVTLPPVGCYEISLISGDEYSFSAFPVLSVNGVEKPFCNSRGYPTGGDVWKAGDTVTVVYVDDKFIDVSSAVGSGSGITVYPTEEALNEDLPNVEDGTLVGTYGDGDGFNDAPLGSTMSYLGTTDPANGKWLICDGRDTTGTAVELETHYPNLYMFLGGTNVLPYTVDRNSPLDYTRIVTRTVTGGQTDTWTATDAGLVVASFTGFNSASGSLSINNVLVTSNTINNNAMATGGGGSVFVEKGDVVKVYQGYHTTTCKWSFIPFSRYKIIKATDSATIAPIPSASVQAIEQYFDNGIGTVKNNGLSYSTTETLTGGKWIDGKPIYRWVYDNGSYVSNLDIDVSSLNIDVLIHTEVIGNDNTSGTGNKWDFGATTARDAYINISNNHLVTSGNLYKRYAIIEYTKTTD